MIRLSGISKTYGAPRRAVVALDRVDLEVREGEVVVVVGPSGSGKSTLLRCLAGLEELDAGRVEVGGRDVTARPPGERDVAMVFQEHALYPHLDVRTNIAFPLLARKTPPDEVVAAVAEIARMLDIGAVLDRRPHELSGGERRRVALGRAVIRKPAAFLMDEPLASLDVTLKLRVLDEIRALLQRVGVATLYVTHDQAEALALGDRIAVMRAGRLEQSGEPREVYDRPANVFVASFIGRTPMNLFPGAAVRKNAATIGVRPEACTLVGDGEGLLSGVIENVELLGSNVLVEILAAGERIRVEVPRRSAPERGMTVGVAADERDLLRFDDSGRAIA